MRDITIRPAVPADYERLTQVWIEGQTPFDDENGAAPVGLHDELRARLPREIASGDWSVFAAESDGVIGGLLAINLRDGTLNQLFVAKALRSSGIGKAMMDVAKTRMPDGFWLRTHTRNVKGHRFYEREGLIASTRTPGRHVPAIASGIR